MKRLNTTLLLAALSLVVFLLIVIYRSPMFFLIPLVSVLFAEALSRSLNVPSKLVAPFVGVAIATGGRSEAAAS